MRSPSMLQQVEANLQGTDQPYINTSDMPHILVPLAPVAEQTAILTIVNRSLDIQTTVEEQRYAVLAEFDQLDQAILAKAFRGELVPQDPNDEPASALLERIREQRTQQAGATKRKKKTATTQQKSEIETKSAVLASPRQLLADMWTAKSQPMAPEQLLLEY